MKKATFCLTLMFVAATGFQAVAQLPVMDIPYEIPAVGANPAQSFLLKTTIDNDAGAHVYQLERGGIYWLEGTIEHNFPLHITGKAEPADLRPALIMYLTDAQGEAPDWMFQCHNDLHLSHIYFAAIDNLGNQHRVANGPDNGLRLVVDHCFFNYSSEHHSTFQWRSKEADVFITNCFVMNTQEDGGYTWTKFLRTSGPDTVIFQNNTFFNGSSAVISSGKNAMEGPKFGLFEHNTIVNFGKDPIHHQLWVNTIQRNNLFVNPLIHGDAIKADAAYTDRQQDSDNSPYAGFRVDTLETYFSAAAWDSILALVGVPHQTVIVNRSNWWWHPDLLTYLDALPDTNGLVPDVIGANTLLMNEDKAAFPGIRIDVETCWSVDPGLTKDPTDVQRLIAWSDFQYFGGEGVNFKYDPDENPLTFEWPFMGEYVDFTYSNEALKSADGFHIGDLNWYPDEKAAWIAQGGSTVRAKTVPAQFELAQNYPNPFNPTTAISYTVTQASHLELSIYNVMGEKIKTLVSEHHTAGAYHVVWNATDALNRGVAAGVYIYRLEAENRIMMKKMLLVK